jgi:eukaryotic-like serine/threonine-protein kinase
MRKQHELFGQPPEARIGSTIRQKWRVDALLGMGGMAAVYAATHANGRRAALKILHRTYKNDPKSCERFVREGYLGNKINHPGGVECLDHDITDTGEHYLVLELLKGESLQELWKRNEFQIPYLDALRIMEQVLDCLSACHRVGMVHRDIKPSNIFITDDGRIKILDFGIAQLRDGNTEHTRAGVTLGTPSFMAPEQAKGGGEKLDGRADIYSVGAVLFTVLTGEKLHKGRSIDESLILAATEPARSLGSLAPSLPKAVIALVDRALAVDRRERWNDAQEMRSEILNLIQEIAPQSAAPKRATSEPTIRTPLPGQAGESSLLPDDHPDVVRLRSFFKLVERMLPQVQQTGWTHSESIRKFYELYEILSTALGKDRDCFHWAIRPYSLTHRGRDIWEPPAPWDQIIFRLFEHGVRKVQCFPGTSEVEFRKLIEWLLIDPVKQLPPEDDLVTWMWEQSLEHIQLDVVDGEMNGDAEERENYLQQVVELERIAKVAINPLRIPNSSVPARSDQIWGEIRPTSGSLGVDPTISLALAAQLDISDDYWVDMYVEVAFEAFMNAKLSGEAYLVTRPLRILLETWARTNKILEILVFYRRLAAVAKRKVERPELDFIRSELTTALFGRTTYQLVLKFFNQLQPDKPEWKEISTIIQHWFRYFDTSEVLNVAEGLTKTTDEILRASMLEFIERKLDGLEDDLADRFLTMPNETVRELLVVFGNKRTPAALRILEDYKKSNVLELRIEAIIQCSQDADEMSKSLGKLARNKKLEVRLAALKAMAHRNIKAIEPILLQRIEDESFHFLPPEERSVLLDSLHTLNTSLAEAAAVALLMAHGMFRNQPLEQSRLVAASYLIVHSSTLPGLEALQSASRKWWWNSERLRELAAEGVVRVSQRLEAQRKRIASATSSPVPPSSAHSSHPPSKS